MNLAIFLSAIATIESGNNDLATGKAGEVSRYQITPLVWRAYAKRGESPIVASDAAKVAERFITAEILPALQRRGKAQTVKAVAACWNYGPKAAYTPWPPKVTDYAERVAVIYEIHMRRDTDAK